MEVRHFGAIARRCVGVWVQIAYAAKRAAAVRCGLARHVMRYNPVNACSGSWSLKVPELGSWPRNALWLSDDHNADRFVDHRFVKRQPQNAGCGGCTTRCTFCACLHGELELAIYVRG